MLESIVEKFIDDPESLDEKELTALLEALKKDPGLVRELKENLGIDHLLSSSKNVFRRDFPAQVDQRLRDLRNSPRIDSLLPKLDRNTQSHWKSMPSIVLALAACIMIFVGLTLMWHLASSRSSFVAKIADAQGVFVASGGGSRGEAGQGRLIHSGDKMFLEPLGFALVEYPDHSLLRFEAIGAESELHFGEGGKAESPRNSIRHPTLISGRLIADIRKQAVDQPLTIATSQALVTVHGTRFVLQVGKQTHLAMQEGKVAVENRKTGEVREVSSGEYLNISENGFTIPSELETGLFAALIGDTQKMSQLLANGMDANLAASEGGMPALTMAAADNHAEMVRMLIQHGARLNVQDVKSMTALHEAADNNRPEIVRILLENGADPTLKNRQGFTPRKMAENARYQKVLAEFDRFGVKQ